MNVVSLPQESTYGKLRCCAYTPIDYAKFDDDGHIIPYDVEQGFDCKYAAQTIYEGLLSYQNETNKYEIKSPIVEDINMNPESITDNLLELAKQCILTRSGE